MVTRLFYKKNKATARFHTRLILLKRRLISHYKSHFLQNVVISLAMYMIYTCMFYIYDMTSKFEKSNDLRFPASLDHLFNGEICFTAC